MIQGASPAVCHPDLRCNGIESQRCTQQPFSSTKGRRKTERLRGEGEGERRKKKTQSMTSRGNQESENSKVDRWMSWKRRI